ncbi:MAG TPA: hypothetical protein VFF70_09740, partial [Anaerolineae bacterium]|nr:hypothetical protein [Anaerolineae bacterium]
VVGMGGAFVYGQYSGLSPLAIDVKATELQIRLESQTLAHWIMIAIILLGMLSALFSRDGRRSAA